MDPRLLQDINLAEGRSLKAYKDDLGNWTIGVGHLLDKARDDWTGYTISPAQSNAYLTQDLSEKQTQAEGQPEWKSLNTPCRQNAVIECVFNLGIGHWVREFP